jgi:hypothetical protein
VGARERAVVVAIAVAAVLHLMLDSDLVRDEPSPRFLSASLVALGVVFGLGAWAASMGGRRDRVPLLAGLSLGAVAYALVRLALL